MLQDQKNTVCKRVCHGMGTCQPRLGPAGTVKGLTGLLHWPGTDFVDVFPAISFIQISTHIAFCTLPKLYQHLPGYKIDLGPVL